MAGADARQRLIVSVTAEGPQHEEEELGYPTPETQKP